MNVSHFSKICGDSANKNFTHVLVKYPGKPSQASEVQLVDEHK